MPLPHEPANRADLAGAGAGGCGILASLSKYDFSFLPLSELTSLAGMGVVLAGL